MKRTLFKHINNTDVAAEFLKNYYIPEKKTYKIKISWWNIVNPDNIYPIGITETITISKEKINDWKIYK